MVLSRYRSYDTAFDPIVLFACFAQHAVDAFLLSYGDLTAVVPSPELLVDVSGRRLVTNPLAGTRPRSADTCEDERLSGELLRDHKELVEHVVSVMAMIAEIESVCTKESVRVTRLLDVARFERVQHLSSTICGTLAGRTDALDALWALFPAVTVTGLPKRQAIATLRDIEDSPRYLYGGVVGSLAGANDCRFSLAIRALFRGLRSFVHAGAGIMAESTPEGEWAETNHKLSAMQDALAKCAALAGFDQRRSSVASFAPTQPI